MVAQVLGAGGIMVLSVFLALRCLMILDKDHGLSFSAGTLRMLCLGSLIAAAIWYQSTVEMEMGARLAWLVIHIFFLCCGVTDHQTCQVYDIFQYPGILLSAYLLWNSPHHLWVGVSLILFALLQYFVFMRMYGKGDGMVLLTAAVAEASLGYDISVYLLHMIVAYLLLGLVQGIKGNIGRKGKLARPVAFVPYIVVGFWIIVEILTIL